MCVHVHMCVCIRVYVHVFVCTCVCACVCLHVHVCQYTYACVCYCFFYFWLCFLSRTVYYSLLSWWRPPLYIQYHHAWNRFFKYFIAALIESEPGDISLNTNSYSYNYSWLFGGVAINRVGWYLDEIFYIPLIQVRN